MPADEPTHICLTIVEANFYNVSPVAWPRFCCARRSIGRKGPKVYSTNSNGCSGTVHQIPLRGDGNFDARWHANNWILPAVAFFPSNFDLERIGSVSRDFSLYDIDME